MTLDPRFYARLTPLARKRALQSAISFTILGNTVLALAKLRGADVGMDPTSSDFGKIVLGDKDTGTRVDIWGGHNQYPRLITQMITGKLTSARTGKEIDLRKGGFLNRYDILLGSAEAKTTPAISFALKMLKGRDFKGDEVTFSEEVVDFFLPIIVTDLYELSKEDPSLIPTLGTAAFLGVGSQQFGETELKRDLVSLTRLNDFEARVLRKKPSERKK
jgi:hypothetical protein